MNAVKAKEKKRSRKPTKPAEMPDLSQPFSPKSILVIDIGGTNVKMLSSGQTEERKFPSGKRLTPSEMIKKVTEMTKGWKYEAVSIGYPGLVGDSGPRAEPGNLGSGWVGFNFAAAFNCPVKVINDAAMQGMGSYEGGRMLFLGFGTGLGAVLITNNVVVPLELGQLRSPAGGNLGERLGRKGLKKNGKEKWRKEVSDAVANLAEVFGADYVVVGGGNAKKLKKALPPGTRMGHNRTAFRGGFRLWNITEIPALTDEGIVNDKAVTSKTDWKFT